MCNVQLTHPLCNMSKHDKLDWDTATVGHILAMLTVMHDGCQVEIRKGSFTTLAA